MPKKYILVVAAFIAVASARGEVVYNFDNIDEPDELIETVNRAKVRSKVDIVGDDDHTIRIFNTEKPGMVKLPTGMDEPQDFELTFDWKNKHKNAGEVFRIGDWNHTKITCRMNIIGQSVEAWTFSAKKWKKRKIFKPEAGTWYRFAVTVSDGRYSFSITDRGPDNSDDGDIVYDSNKMRKRFRINPGVTPSQVFLAQWPGDGKNFYEYDNITISN